MIIRQKSSIPVLTTSEYTLLNYCRLHLPTVELSRVSRSNKDKSHAYQWVSPDSPRVAEEVVFDDMPVMKVVVEERVTTLEGCSQRELEEHKCCTGFKFGDLTSYRFWRIGRGQINSDRLRPRSDFSDLSDQLSSNRTIRLRSELSRRRFDWG